MIWGPFMAVDLRSIVLVLQLPIDTLSEGPTRASRTLPSQVLKHALSFWGSWMPKSISKSVFSGVWAIVLPTFGVQVSLEGQMGN